MGIVRYAIIWHINIKSIYCHHDFSSGNVTPQTCPPPTTTATDIADFERDMYVVCCSDCGISYVDMSVFLHHVQIHLLLFRNGQVRIS